MSVEGVKIAPLTVDEPLGPGPFLESVQKGGVTFGLITAVEDDVEPVKYLYDMGFGRPQAVATLQADSYNFPDALNSRLKEKKAQDSLPFQVPTI